MAIVKLITGKKIIVKQSRDHIVDERKLAKKNGLPDIRLDRIDDNRTESVWYAMESIVYYED